MRLPWALLLSAAALHVQAHVVVRQDGGNNPSGTSAAPSATSSNGNGGNNGGSSTSADTPTSSSGSNGGGGQDTTVFRTETVTDGNAETITSRTTARTTSTFTVVVISTLFQTSTLTQQGETATKTIYETTTVIDNNKRGLIDLGPRTLPIAVEAYPTEEPIPSVTSVDWNNLDMARNKMQRDNVLNKRATVTEVRTVTVGGNDSGTTVVNTVTQTVVVTTSVISTTTRQVTETDVQDAKTTQTVTSTLTVTSTAVTTGVQTTQTSENNNNDNNNNNNSNNNSDDGGLSTGAKAGIGAGVGVAGLLILGALAFFCIRRRRRGPKADPDAMAGASEVPVGGPVGGTPPMSHQGSTHHAAAAGLLSPHGRAPPTKTSPEGYRGTAMGDGRAGYAKPSPYGAAYTQPTSTSPTNRSSTLNSSSPFSPTGQTVSSMGADSLPSHPGPNDHTGAAELGNDGNAAAGRWQNPGAVEMDSTGIGHQSSAPPENVYEMPAQNYR